MSAITHLQFLESEAIYILRETAAQFEKPALLFSGGKDSIVMAWLARKAFYPSRLPFKLLHVDTGHNFPEAMTYRDWFVQEIGADLVVGSVQKSIDDGRVQEEKGHNASRNKLQTVTLLDTIEEHQFDACLGGGRRDEEKARAKERFFSHRNEFGQWDPKNQRPELWNIFNGRKHFGEHFRVFPLSNWTEMDIWQYIRQENIPLPSLYFSHKRQIIERHGQLLAVGLNDERGNPIIPLLDEEKPRVKEMVIRFRTVGDASCTGAVESTASTIDDIVAEVAAARQTERGTRADDKRSETAMEDRKKEGYF
ncbi:MAG: sulfate adenylyltransferase subunit CysD [Verrucomicrobiaceae bacterium]|jgi:sulfate adenylyltransferase subunit 2|uniref:sulfate adenylyltransferase subunit CysD n=1 Tax=Prosthecobacter sp. TaxID=1965333 RepID=UPI001A024613|nr:sulfate adenylyltransferase subunit CysD [Prosthecobacter sp.]MBE2287713.1 sulfate adenylyltransferase subunit CysD [Prosthecobacter sp.]MBE7493578.1 sulfate adenylyltransferase subunit CysD [Verrucomicrobiaceae bacterium]